MQNKKNIPYFNREISWLSFNRRVLYQAQTNTHPLLERVKFIAIFNTNLDEFFMIRVAGLERQLETKPSTKSPDGKQPLEQLKRIRSEVKNQLLLSQQLFYNDIQPKLEKKGIVFSTCNKLDSNTLSQVEAYFEKNIYPTLIPLAFDPGRPFPHLSNLSLSLAVQLRNKRNKDPFFARVKIPSNLPRLINLEHITKRTYSKDIVYLWSNDIISTFIGKLFPNLTIESVHQFRITRDADLEIEEDEAHDLLDSVSESLQQRRYGKIVKLDISQGMPNYIKKILISNLEITDRKIYDIPGYIDLSSLIELTQLTCAKIQDKPFIPRQQLGSSLYETDIFLQIKKKDRLLYHPFDSFDPVIAFLEQAAKDPDVITIKQTLYRVGSKSPIVKALTDAARQGKQVAAILELKARFDEENNISWAKKLEQEGVHVVYGLIGLKVHSKMLLVVRKEPHGIQHYVHLGTGNYNPSTAKSYTDYSLFTTHTDICQDVANVFNYLTGYSDQKKFRKLLVSPITMRKELLEKIRREATYKTNGRIIIKANSLVDIKGIQALYDASQAGVKIDLIIRGTCSILPNIKGVSENIRVTSIIGRFLEHSRVFYFQNGGKEDLLVGSADFMERNLDRRVEVLFPILTTSLIERIKYHLEVMLQDNETAWILSRNGTYKHRTPTQSKKRIHCQEQFLKNS